jgi:UDP-glucose 4-epimerase
MIKIIGGSGFIGTRLSKRLTLSKKEFNIVDKVKSKSFSAICNIADVSETESLSKQLKIISPGYLNRYQSMVRRRCISNCLRMVSR